jgi:light-regulated signal transduction histidine kinase (bacteriophytochrome)
MGAIYNRFKLYGLMAGIVMVVSLCVAYLLSRRLQKTISKPILALGETAKIIAVRKDYSVRAIKQSDDEFGLFTDTFNQMLEQIEVQNQKIKSFNEALEQRILERTQELEASNKELEAFSYSVSHDLRAPLRSIDGYARILLEDYSDKVDEEGKRTLQIIIKNALKMGQLIDDLLDFSRLGKQNVSKISLDMAAITLRLVEEIAPQQYAEQKITINPLLNGYGDSAMLRQVMANLITNAVKYSSKKEKPYIEIGSYQEHNEIVYFVKDNGAGFDMNYYSKLFGVFQRLHSVAEFEGTGVGLALVHRIVTKHGGRIWAEGKVNEGATFYFSLPLV